MSFLFHKPTLLSLLLLAVSANGQPVFALDGTGKGGKNGYSVDEVTRMIRDTGGWKVLSTQTVPNNQGADKYRFKLLHKDGRVKVLSVDPRSPNLGKLK